MRWVIGCQWQPITQRTPHTQFLSDKEPGSLLFPALFVGGDLVAVGKRPADVVQAVEQSLFAEMIDLEGNDAPGWRS